MNFVYFTFGLAVGSAWQILKRCDNKNRRAFDKPSLASNVNYQKSSIIFVFEAISAFTEDATF